MRKIETFLGERMLSCFCDNSFRLEYQGYSLNIPLKITSPFFFRREAPEIFFFCKIVRDVALDLELLGRSKISSSHKETQGYIMPRKSNRLPRVLAKKTLPSLLFIESNLVSSLSDILFINIRAGGVTKICVR